jgi:putative DNA base modification enzyme with NMAD domain
MSQQLYVYKLTADNGCAPCPDGHLLTLAICKPGIRAGAQVGDLLFGFAANSLNPDNRLIYIARVTAVEEDGDYYQKTTYKQRADWIYVRGDDRKFRVRPGVRCHGSERELAHDLGTFPEYERARVLVSNDFRYFGSSGESAAVELGPYPRVSAMLRGSLRPYRVNHSAEEARELWQLKRAAWSDHPATIVSAPSTSPGCVPSERMAPSCAPPRCN